MATRRAAVLSDAPLVVIVGPTASGKTSAAIQLAEECGGEIICADSRTIYRGMDIGTAKPSTEEQARVPHWGIDLVEPGQRFTAADFKNYANKKIEEIRQRGKIPFLVGGTGLYIDAVVFDYQFGGDMNIIQRKRLNSLTIDELVGYCIKSNISLPDNKSKRRLVRAIERGGAKVSKRDVPVDNSIIVGVTTDKSILDERITRRTERLFKDGVVEEATRLRGRYGWENEALTGNIYRVIALHICGELSEADMKKEAVALDRRLAKRQMTWFKRNPYIKWLSITEVGLYIRSHLANL